MLQEFWDFLECTCHYIYIHVQILALTTIQNEHTSLDVYLSWCKFFIWHFGQLNMASRVKRTHFFLGCVFLLPFSIKGSLFFLNSPNIKYWVWSWKIQTQTQILKKCTMKIIFYLSTYVEKKRRCMQVDESYQLLLQLVYTWKNKKIKFFKESSCS